MKAICVKATRHHNPGDIVDIPDESHPFITSGDFIVDKIKVDTITPVIKDVFETFPIKKSKKGK